MSTPRPDVVLSRPHVHNTTMSHDAEVLRNPTHKIPPEFARVLSRSYQRYLSENMKMCVSYRVWGQLLFKVEGFISFAWFRICFRKNRMQIGLTKEKCQGTTFQSRNWFREVVIFVLCERRPAEAGRNCGHERDMPQCHLCVLIIWVNLSTATKVQLQVVQTLSWMHSAQKKKEISGSNLSRYFLLDIKLINRWTSTNIFVGHLITWESQVQKAAEKQTSRNKRIFTRRFTEKMCPPEFAKVTQDEKAPARSCLGKICISMDLWRISLWFCWGWISVCSWEATMVPKVCTALEQQNYGFSKSQRGDLLSVVKHFHRDSMGLAIRPHHMCHLMCSLSLRSSGRDSGREK